MKSFKTVLKEQKHNLDENIGGVKVDREFTKMSKMSRDIKDEWRDIKRVVKRSLDVSDQEIEAIGDDIEDALMDLNKALNNAQDKIKTWDK